MRNYMGEVRSALVAIVLGAIIGPLALFFLGWWNIDDLGEFLHGAGKELGGHVCNGEETLTMAELAISEVRKLDSENKHEAFTRLHNSIQSFLSESAACGNERARAWIILATCDGSFGYEESRFEAKRLIAQYETDGGFDAGNSPYRDLCV